MVESSGQTQGETIYVTNRRQIEVKMVGSLGKYIVSGARTEKGTVSKWTGSREDRSVWGRTERQTAALTVPQLGASVEAFRESQLGGAACFV